MEPASKHWKITHPDGRAYTIPAHNGERSEVGKFYLKALCRTFGLDEDEIRRG